MKYVTTITIVLNAIKGSVGMCRSTTAPVGVTTYITPLLQCNIKDYNYDNIIYHSVMHYLISYIVLYTYLIKSAISIIPIFTFALYIFNARKMTTHH